MTIEEETKLLEEISIKMKLLEHKIEDMSMELTRLTDILMGL